MIQQVTNLEYLQRTRDWLADPEHWTQGASYKDVDGNIIWLVDPSVKVQRTCALGGLDYIGQQLGVEPSQFESVARVLHNLAMKYFRDTVVGVNDALGHEAVLELFDLTIEKEKTDAPS